MVADHLVIYDYKHDKEKIGYSDIIRKMHEFGFRYNKEYNFVAGSMFIAKSGLFKYIKCVYIQSDFIAPDKEHSTGLPHILERILGYSVCVQGYKIVSFDGKNPDNEYRRKIFKNLFFKVKYTTNHIVVKIMGIPLFFKRK